jgi:hypothetical protein
MSLNEPTPPYDDKILLLVESGDSPYSAAKVSRARAHVASPFLHSRIAI